MMFLLFHLIFSEGVSLRIIFLPSLIVNLFFLLAPSMTIVMLGSLYICSTIFFVSSVISTISFLISGFCGLFLFPPLGFGAFSTGAISFSFFVFCFKR